MTWCGYPQLRSGVPPFKINEPFWMCLEPKKDSLWFDSLVVSKIAEARKRGRGGMAIISKLSSECDLMWILILKACGDSSFMQGIRKGVVSCHDNLGIDYIEAEYCPRTTFKNNGAQEKGGKIRRRKDTVSSDIEMQNLAHRTSEESMYSVASGWESS